MSRQNLTPDVPKAKRATTSKQVLKRKDHYGFLSFSVWTLGYLVLF